MFGQIAPTDFDLNFSLFGVPVRVHPLFWVSSAVLAWDEQGDLPVIAVGIACIFVAIIVHELGHALMNRCFGWNSEIVLYLFGGYATTTHHSTWKNIAVLVAGPAAGFLLFLTVGLSWLFFLRDAVESNPLAATAVSITLYISLVWNIINLFPVLPLDGGQISRELCCWLSPRHGLGVCLKLSIVSGGLVALLAAFYGEPYAALMFGYLAFQSYQALNEMARGYWR
jgi:Zn-dependent protease